MARRKFPSDGRPWFRCLTDILHDPKLNGDCPVDVAWFYIRLLAILETTKSKGGQIALDKRGLNFCAAREQYRHALRVARTGALRGLYTLSVDGVQTLITVPNWPELQGYAPVESTLEEKRGEERKERRERREKRPASPTPSPKKSPKGKARKPAAKTNPRKGETVCPEDLTPEQWLQVRSWRDRKHPEIGDPMLRREWEKHSAHWRAVRKPRKDWAASFEKWLLKALEIQRSDPRAERSQPPDVVREKPPPRPTAEEIAGISEQYEEARLKAGFKRRRRTPPKREK